MIWLQTLGSWIPAVQRIPKQGALIDRFLESRDLPFPHPTLLVCESCLTNVSQWTQKTGTVWKAHRDGSLWKKKKRQGKPQDPETSRFKIIKISNKGNQILRGEKWLGKKIIALKNEPKRYLRTNPNEKIIYHYQCLS